MATLTVNNSATDTLVGMGQIAVGRAPDRMKAILGSCIGLVLYHARLQTAAMAHIVLPDSAGRPGAAGKFADTAIPEMLRLLRELETPSHGLTAKLAGGGNMFGSTGPLQIGDANAEAVARVLKSIGIVSVSREVGGTKGRRVVFDCASGEMTVECAGQPPRVL
jgi:chemotaxis protein CheD